MSQAPSQELEEDSPLYYFGYGSNMSLLNLKVKLSDIKTINISRGILKDYKLVFNLGSRIGNSGVANIAPSIGDSVHGAYYQLTKEQFNKIDLAETSYDKIMVDIIPYENDKKSVKCFVYISTQEILKSKNLSNDGIVYDDIKNNKLKPSENYLKTLIRAGKDIKLNEDYINMLNSTEYNKIITINDLKREEVLDFYKRINVKTFTMNDIKNSENSENPLSYFYGIVLNVKHSIPIIKERCKGKNMADLMEKRYYLYDLYLKDKNKYEKDVRKYAIGELLFGRNIKLMGIIVGKLDDKIYGYKQFNWENDIKRIIGF